MDNTTQGLIEAARQTADIKHSVVLCFGWTFFAMALFLAVMVCWRVTTTLKLRDREYRARIADSIRWHDGEELHRQARRLNG